MDHRAHQHAGTWRAEVLITLPFFVPPILTAMAWGMLGNPQVGVINLAWRWSTGSDNALVNVYSYGGVVWHMLQYSTPFLFLFVVEAFARWTPRSGRPAGCAAPRSGGPFAASPLLPDDASHR